MVEHPRSRLSAVMFGSRSVLRELWQAVLDHDLPGLAAQLAYRFELATLWLLIFFAALSGYVAETYGGSNPTQRLMESTFSRSPSDVKPILEAQLQQLVDAHSPVLLVGGALGALWTGMAGFTALMKALNEVYGIREGRPYLRRLLLSAAITTSIGTLLLAILVLTLVRQIAGEEIADVLGVPAGLGRAADLLNLAVSIPLLIGATAVLYRALPDRSSGTRWMSLGALLFVVGWLGATLLFGAYLANFPSYANVYGVIGMLLVLLTWFFATSFTLLLGAEVDALRGRSRDQK